MPPAANVSVVSNMRKYYCAFEKSLPALGLTSLLFSGYRRSFPGVKQRRHEVTTHFHLVLGLRMSGGLSLLSI